MMTKTPEKTHSYEGWHDTNDNHAANLKLHYFLQMISLSTIQMVSDAKTAEHWQRCHEFLESQLLPKTDRGLTQALAF